MVEYRGWMDGWMDGWKKKFGGGYMSFFLSSFQ